MLHKTKVSPSYREYAPDASLIEDFFSNCGDAKSINEVLWDMFASSISNPDDCVDSALCAQRSYLYKRLSEFMIAIEPPKPPKQIPFSNN